MKSVLSENGHSVHFWTQKRTLLSIFFSIFICMDKIKEELKTVPLLYNLYGFIRFKRKFYSVASSGLFKAFSSSSLSPVAFRMVSRSTPL